MRQLALIFTFCIHLESIFGVIKKVFMDYRTWTYFKIFIVAMVFYVFIETITISTHTFHILLQRRKLQNNRIITKWQGLCLTSLIAWQQDALTASSSLVNEIKYLNSRTPIRIRFLSYVKVYLYFKTLMPTRW